MPTIQSFKAILPHPAKAEKVVILLENLSLESAKEIRSVNPESFVHLLVPKIENHYLRGSKQEITFQKIAENFEDFIQKNILIKDETANIYIYRQQNKQHSYIGIWTASSIDDYINNKIKKHELTRAEREKGLIEYLQQTGIDANPVLITYPENQKLEEIIKNEIQKEPAINISLEGAQHQVWRVSNPLEVNDIIQIFKEMPDTYIADGHHRAAAASTYGIERRKLNLKHKGTEDYNFFSSVYMSSNQLSILPFHRFVKLTESQNSDHILTFIRKEFKLTEIELKDLIPVRPHFVGFYIQHKAYQINLQNHLKNEVLADLDVSIIQEKILSPLFQIDNPREDQRLQFVGGDVDLASYIKKVDEGIFDMGFLLFPISVAELIKIADIGEIMPPKSTWFEPKFLVGLVTHQIN
jgi:uncharacterized protein (DUF1015 family)